MISSCPIYLFRSPAFAPSGDTIVAVASLATVIGVYGGGGVWGEGGLSSSFGGVAVFKNDASGDHFAGIWGARNAARFRRDLQARMPIAVLKQAPDARLVYWSTNPAPSVPRARYRPIA